MTSNTTELQVFLRWSRGLLEDEVVVVEAMREKRGE